MQWMCNSSTPSNVSVLHRVSGTSLLCNGDLNGTQIADGMVVMEGVFDRCSFAFFGSSFARRISTLILWKKTKPIDSSRYIQVVSLLHRHNGCVF